MSSAGAQEGAAVFAAVHLAAHRVSKSFGGPEELAAGDRPGSPVLGTGRGTSARGSKAGSLRSSSSMAERSVGGASRAGSPLEDPNVQAIFKSPRHGNRSGLSVQAFPLSDGSLGGYSSYGGAQSPTHASAALQGGSPRLTALSTVPGSPRAAATRLAAVAAAAGERAASPAALDALHGAGRLGSPRRPGAVAAVDGSGATAAVAAREQVVEGQVVAAQEAEQAEQPANAGLVAKPEPAADAPVTAAVAAAPEAAEDNAPATAVSATSGVILAAIRTLSPSDSRSSSAGGGAGTLAGRRPIGAVRCDSRYSELLFRLVQFLPSIKEAAAASTSAAATPWSDQAFEATWELIKAELSSLMAAARVASQQASRLQMLDREVSQLQSMLALIRRQVGTASSGGGAAAAAAAELNLDRAASGLGPAAAEAPAGDSEEGRRSAGGRAAVPAPAPRGGWGRSVPSQETGLWDSAPLRASAGSAGPNSRGGLSATMPPRPRGPFASPERVVRTSAGGAADRRSSRGGALQKPTPTVHPKISADVAQQLTALYKSAKFQDPDVRGYHVIRTSTTMASDGGRAAGAAASAAAPALAAVRPEGGSLRRLSTGGAGGVLLAGDRPGFAVAKEAFQARIANLSTRATMPVAALGGNDKWFARLAGRKAATAGEVDGMIAKLSKVLAKNDVPLALERLGPFTYAAAGKRLHLREVNGALLVRTGGGYDELMTVLAKLPYPAAAKA